MFGKRSGTDTDLRAPKPGAVSPEPAPALAPTVSRAPPPPAVASPPLAPARPAPAMETRRSDNYYEVKATIFGALIEAIDLAQLAKLDSESAREEIRDIVNEIIAIKNIVMSIAEQEELLDDICNDVLGYGPLEPLLSRDDIADIMVNGANTVYIEVGGKIQRTGIRFRDNQQLLNICQRIVSQVGRRVDESSPICDARLADGSRVNAIVPPLSIDGPALTIRKFKKDKLTLDQLVKFGAISPEGAEILQIIGRVRCNVLISGGTGSGKTTLLNCLTNYIEHDERIITCEDAAELQLQQPHVVRLETRPPNIEGEGQITMRELVRNCLRMRPERIIVGEVRGPEAFDLLQAMNTGHDGSMGTLHANNPREALSRCESMITMGRLLAAVADHPRDDLRLDRRHRPGRPPARRLAPHHAHHRGDGHGRRHHHHPGHLPLRHDRRGRQRQDHRAAPLDRHRPSEVLGTRSLLRRREAPCRRTRCGGSGANDVSRSAPP
ncbi:pilus assembly protein CpaF [Bradyrhizobium diazoefficiens]